MMGSVNRSQCESTAISILIVTLMDDFDKLHVEQPQFGFDNLFFAGHVDTPLQPQDCIRSVRLSPNYFT